MTEHQSPGRREEPQNCYQAARRDLRTVQHALDDVARALDEAARDPSADALEELHLAIADAQTAFDEMYGTLPLQPGMDEGESTPDAEED